MSRNIELKASLHDLEAAHRIAHDIGADVDGTEWQRDTYFKVRDGRLKLRERRFVHPRLGNAPAGPEFQLIWYQRRDAARPRPSDYLLVSIVSGEQFRALLAAALPVTIEVTKTRAIYLYDRVRIHLDRVEQLGTFIELEAIVDASCTDTQADGKIQWLRRAFGIVDEHLHSTSYADLHGDRAAKSPATQ